MKDRSKYRWIVYGYKDWPNIVSDELFDSIEDAEKSANTWDKGATWEVVEVVSSSD